MSFKDVALPMAARGIRQTPSLTARHRGPGIKDWPNLATTDEAQILKWDSNGYHDYNSCSVADDDLAIIDIDDYAQAKALGFPLIKTFSVKTPGGGYHLYYRQTERSRISAAANRAIPGVVEFKHHSAAVASPGCKRDDMEGDYEIRWDLPIIDFPDALLDWLESHIQTRKTKESVPVAEDFDFEDFCDHYGISGHQNGAYFITDVCPYSGTRHSGSKATGFYWDGEFLGFKCFSDDCQVGIGGLIKYLNETHEHYPHDIWPKDDQTLTDDELEELGVEIVDSSLSPQELAAQIGAKMVEKQDEATVPTRPSGLLYPELKFPYDAIAPGRFKDLVDLACDGGVSRGLVAVSIMTLASAIPTKHVMCGQRINVFSLLLALAGGGKDLAINRAVSVLGLEDFRFKLFTEYCPSGEKKLASIIGNKVRKTNGVWTEVSKGPAHTCLVSKELLAITNKARGENSGLFQAFQRLWDSNYEVYPDIQGDITIDCRFSWLTGLAVGEQEIDIDSFQEALGKDTGGGFASRLWLAFEENRVDARRIIRWVPPTYSREEKTIQATEFGDVQSTIVHNESPAAALRKSEVSDYDPEVYQQLMAWDIGQDMSGRDSQHIQKVCIITALLNGHKTVTQIDFDFAVAFMSWQKSIRQMFKHGTAKNETAVFYEAIVESLKRKIARYDGINTKNVKKVGNHIYVRWRKLAQDGNWGKYGFRGKTETVLSYLAEIASIAYLVEDGTNNKGEPSKETNKNWITIVPKIKD